jgi:succinate dehydrogenase hydrophobic anchor subunit
MAESIESPAPRQGAPTSVQRAVGLLRLQATIWALLCVGTVADGSANLALQTVNPSWGTVNAVVFTVVLALGTGLIAVAKFRLAYRLPRGSRRTLETVIDVEMVMAFFAGLVLLFLVFSGFGLILSPPFIIGGIMSARVARGLTKPPAQQYFDANQALDGQSAALASPEGGTPTQFRGYLVTA